MLYHVADNTFSINGRQQAAHVKLGQLVTMRVFLDRSIAEAYVNGNAQTARIFPPADALGLNIITDDGKAKLTSLEVWKMNSMWKRP